MVVATLGSATGGAEVQDKRSLLPNRPVVELTGRRQDVSTGDHGVADVGRNYGTDSFDQRPRQVRGRIPVY